MSQYVPVIVFIFLAVVSLPFIGYLRAKNVQLKEKRIQMEIVQNYDGQSDLDPSITIPIYKKDPFSLWPPSIKDIPLVSKGYMRYTEAIALLIVTSASFSIANKRLLTMFFVVLFLSIWPLLTFNILNSWNSFFNFSSIVLVLMSVLYATCHYWWNRRHTPRVRAWVQNLEKYQVLSDKV